MTVKAKSNIELILECRVPPSTGKQSFLMQIHHGGGVKALSDRPNAMMHGRSSYLMVGALHTTYNGKRDNKTLRG